LSAAAAEEFNITGPELLILHVSLRSRAVKPRRYAKNILQYGRKESKAILLICTKKDYVNV